MKIKVTMKDPDTLQDAIADAVREELSSVKGIDDDERESLSETRCADAAEIASKWFKWGEYLAVEIDTEAMTATILPAD